LNRVVPILVPKKAHVRGFGGAGLPSRYRDSVRAIRPGLPLFLYNYSTHQLHGIFEVTPSNSICFLVDPSGSPTNFIVTWYVLFINQAASFGGTNIDPTAWEDKKCPGESRFPAQVSFLPTWPAFPAPMGKLSSSLCSHGG